MSQLFCGACGTKFSTDDKFCKKCGSKRKIAAPDTTQPKPTTKPQGISAPDTPPTPVVVEAQIPKAAPVPTPTQTPVRTSAPTHEDKAKSSDPVKQLIPQKEKKLLTDRRIKSEINTGGTFLWAIILLVAGIICIALTEIHFGLAIIGLMICFSSLLSFIRTKKKIRYRSNYKIVLRKCVKKTVIENEDSNTYYLFFHSFMDSINYMTVDVPQKVYDSTETGDLFYIAASKNRKDENYSVAAYFRESEWRLE